jgi:O-acetyl-ADP-ribose deacetylase (regulator of RNase III)
VIELIQTDITTLKVDAIVNAANSALRGGGGVDGAIHRAAGRGLLEECMLHAGCPTGEAIRTKGYRLAARFVIHAVGPVWQGGQHGERELLESAYESAFRCALEDRTIRTVAFPAISTGIYRFPKDEAARIALTSMRRHDAEFERIVACLFDDEALQLYTDTLSRL